MGLGPWAMMNRLFILGVLGVVGCGGSDGQEQPSSCDPASRSGSYLATFETISGNCGEQSSALVRLDADADPADGGCVRLAADRWSDGNCTLERSVECPFDTLSPGATVETTMISTQRDAAGATITGTVTFTAKDAFGVGLCFGTYRFTANRQ